MEEMRRQTIQMRLQMEEIYDLQEVVELEEKIKETEANIGREKKQKGVYKKYFKKIDKELEEKHNQSEF